MPLRRLHIASGHSGLPIVRSMSMSLIEEARAHAAEQPDSGAEDVETVADIVALFARLRREGVRLEYLDFHTHGGDGQIGIGSDAIFEWSAFAGFQDIFATEARIEFHGCNVADGPDGEFFLVECGSTLLKRGGGSVAGHAGLALALRSLGLPTTTPTYMGGTITARIRVGGGATLQDARFLRPHLLRRRLAELRLQLRVYERERYGPTLRERLRMAHTLLDDAEVLLHGQPSYRNVLRALRKLGTAGNSIRRAGSEYVSRAGPD
jgi:hypothetical protein